MGSWTASIVCQQETASILPEDSEAPRNSKMQCNAFFWDDICSVSTAFRECWWKILNGWSVSHFHQRFPQGSHGSMLDILRISCWRSKVITVTSMIPWLDLFFGCKSESRFLRFIMSKGFGSADFERPIQWYIKRWGLALAALLQADLAHAAVLERYTPVSLYVHHVHVHCVFGKHWHFDSLTDIFSSGSETRTQITIVLRTMVSRELPFPSMSIRVCDMVTPSGEKTRKG